MTHVVERDDADGLVISQSRVLSYRIPHSSGAGSSNYIVQLTGQGVQGDAVGVGESQPRWMRTGDDAGSAWNFIVEATRRLEGCRLSLDSPDATIADIRRLMEDFAQLAGERAVVHGVERPFRGTLLGIEVALLDLVAQQYHLTMAQLLGASGDRSDSLYIARLTVSATPAMFDEAIDEFIAQERAAGRTSRTRIWLSAAADLGMTEAKNLVRLLRSKLQAASVPADIFVTRLFSSQGGYDRAEFTRYLRDLAADEDADVSIRQVEGKSCVDVLESDQPSSAPLAAAAVVIRPAEVGGVKSGGVVYEP